MNKNLLNSKVQEFIFNYNNDISKLAFSGSPFDGISIQELIEQIESRRKIEKKLPTWFQKSDIYYPPKINLEQTSSEITGEYKSSLVQGDKLVDITGGFGIDAYYFSKSFKVVDHIEINESLSNIVKHNFIELGIKNVQCIAGDGLNLLPKKKYDVVYVDPSRRHNIKGKVFLLRDCEPNIPENLDFIMKHCDRLLVKTSPMLDISAGLSELKNVSEIYIVAVNNEVKELLWLIKKAFKETPIIRTINILKNASESFDFQLNKETIASYGYPEKYLYEPNAAIMKSGAFDLLSEVYKIKKLHKNTHLYSSEDLIEFPGRSFYIKDQIPYTKSSVKKTLTLRKANITTRNFPEDVASLRKKWKIKDGGDDYLFFTTLENNEKVILVCTKI